MANKVKTVEQLQEELKEASALLERAESEKDKKDYQGLVDSLTGEIKKLIKDKPSEKKIEKAKVELKIMNRYKIDELFINSKGEYFTSKNLADLTEKDKTKVKIITREISESIVK